MNGKGSARRPPQITPDELATRWAQTFGSVAPVAKPDPVSHTASHEPIERGPDFSVT